MKRFYSESAVAEESTGFAVTLDGRMVNTPGRAPLVLPSAALAEAVATEWRAQGETIEPRAMRLTRLANTAIDRVACYRVDVIAETAGYAATDLLCYRAEHPPDLVGRQDRTWQPVLDWAEGRYGVSFAVTTGVAPVAQSAGALRAVSAAVARRDDFALAALHLATSSIGSVLVGLALAEGTIGADTAWACADLDEAYQEERWGRDREASTRREGLRADVAAAAAFLDLCRQGS